MDASLTWFTGQAHLPRERNDQVMTESRVFEEVEQDPFSVVVRGDTIQITVSGVTFRFQLKETAPHHVTSVADWIRTSLSLSYDIGLGEGLMQGRAAEREERALLDESA